MGTAQTTRWDDTCIITLSCPRLRGRQGPSATILPAMSLSLVGGSSRPGRAAGPAVTNGHSVECSAALVLSRLGAEDSWCKSARAQISWDKLGYPFFPLHMLRQRSSARTLGRANHIITVTNASLSSSNSAVPPGLAAAAALASSRWWRRWSLGGSSTFCSLNRYCITQDKRHIEGLVFSFPG
jgi:hypothetical protein